MTPDSSDTLILPLTDRYREYLGDESRTVGDAESISFPENEAQVQSIVRILAEKRMPITVQGNRTGITGGGVPSGGHVMSLTRMTGAVGMSVDPEGHFLLRVQPGLSLSELEYRLEARRFRSDSWGAADLASLAVFSTSERQFWPPDPSEASASVGGVAAGNSRGLGSHYYGSASDHIHSIRMVDGSGTAYSIARGDYCFQDGCCMLPGGGIVQLDPDVSGQEPPGDLLDMILGSQGMLGVITELTLILRPLPRELWGIVFLFQNVSGAVDFIQAIRQRQEKEPATEMVAVEFMDKKTLDLIRNFRQTNSRLKTLPSLNESFASAVYIEIHGNSSEGVEALCEWLLEKAGESGNDPDSTWTACGRSDVEKLRILRHAAPEAVNQAVDAARRNDARITKLGTDMRVKEMPLQALIDMYRRDTEASGLKAAIFGHAADGHLHVNILPEDFRQYEAGRRVIERWAEQVHALGGSVVTEHGIGKVKKSLFRTVPLPGRWRALISVKQQMDPKGLLNPGNLTETSRLLTSKHS